MKRKHIVLIILAVIIVSAWYATQLYIIDVGVERFNTSGWEFTSHGGDFTISADTPEMVSFIGLRTDSGALLRKNFWQSRFEDFTHHFTFQINSYGAGTRDFVGLWMLCNEDTTLNYRDCDDGNDGLVLYFENMNYPSGDACELALRCEESITGTRVDTYTGIVTSKEYYMTIERIGTQLNAYGYDDVARTFLLFTLTVDCTDETYKWYHPVCPYDTEWAPNTGMVTGFLKNVYLETPPLEGTLTVYAQDSDGNSLTDVTITFQGGTPIQSSAGVETFTLEVGEYTVSVKKEGYAPWIGTATVTEYANTDLYSANTLITNGNGKETPSFELTIFLLSMIGALYIIYRRKKL